MNSILTDIKYAEDAWLQKLFLHCKQIFSGTFLPSHDETHHQRVWEYSKQILQSLSARGKNISSEVVQAALFASFFHDTGMAFDPSPKHGKLSKEKFSEYIKNQNVNYCCDVKRTASVIENHDDKQYLKAGSAIHIVDGIDLLKVLNAADDLDAFGEIGVYRYAEIYLVRGIKMEELPAAVVKNVEKRYKHFEESFGECTDLLQKHRERYEYTRNFFEKMTPGSQQERITWLIKKWVTGEKKTLAEMLVENIFSAEEAGVKSFFTGISPEET